MAINFGNANFSSESAVPSVPPLTLDLNKNSAPFTLDLNKTNGEPLHKIRVSLIWDPVVSGQDFDLDLSAFTLSHGKVTSVNDVCYFKNLHLAHIDHSEDARTGAEAKGDDEDEYMIINLDKVPASAGAVEILVNVYDAEKRQQTFGAARSKLVIKNEDTKKILATINLSNDYFADTAVDAAAITRTGNGWSVVTKGNGYNTDLNGLLSLYI